MAIAVAGFSAKLWTGEMKKYQEARPAITPPKMPGRTPNRKEERMTAGKKVTKG